MTGQKVGLELELDFFFSKGIKGIDRGWYSSAQHTNFVSRYGVM